MKRIILTLLLSSIVLTGFYVQAQKGWTLGAKAGLNISSAGGDFSDANSRLGYNAGIIADYNFSESIFFRTGLDFTAKGTEVEVKYGDTGYQKWNYRLNYMQLPLSFGYKMDVSHNIKLSINAGGYFAYGVYARKCYKSNLIFCYDGSGDAAVVNDNEKGFDNIGMHAFDAGLLGGVGIEYKQYMLLIGYELGLYNTMSGKYDGGDPSWKNRNWSFSLGYRF